MLRLLTCPRGHFWECADDPDGPDGPPRCPRCGAPADLLPVPDLAPGEAPPPLAEPIALPLFDAGGLPVIEGYDQLRDLGKGPGGVRLFRARQVAVGRTVLLEAVAARDDPGQQAWGTLRNTSAALGKLAHPNIIAIFDAGERDRQLFYNAV